MYRGAKSLTWLARLCAPLHDAQHFDLPARVGGVQRHDQDKVSHFIEGLNRNTKDDPMFLHITSLKKFVSIGSAEPCSQSTSTENQTWFHKIVVYIFAIGPRAWAVE